MKLLTFLSLALLLANHHAQGTTSTTSDSTTQFSTTQPLTTQSSTTQASSSTSLAPIPAATIISTGECIDSALSAHKHDAAIAEDSGKSKLSSSKCHSSSYLFEILPGTRKSILNSLKSYYIVSHGPSHSYKAAWPLEEDLSEHTTSQGAIRAIVPFQATRGLLLDWYNGTLTSSGRKNLETFLVAFDGDFGNLSLDFATVLSSHANSSSVTPAALKKAKSHVDKFLRFLQSEYSQGSPKSHLFTSPAYTGAGLDPSKLAGIEKQTAFVLALNQSSSVGQGIDETHFNSTNHAIEYRFSARSQSKNEFAFLSGGTLRTRVRFNMTQANRPQCAISDVRANILFNGLRLQTFKLASSIERSDSVDLNLYEISTHFPTAQIDHIDASQFDPATSTLTIQIAFKTPSSCRAPLAPFAIELYDTQLCQSAPIDKAAASWSEQAAEDEYDDQGYRYFSVDEAGEEAYEDLDDDHYFALLDEIEGEIESTHDDGLAATPFPF